MRTIAEAVGVATSTVSKALRDDPTIPATRREEIRKVAKQLGYQPNPLVTNLMAQLHVRRRRNDPFHLAWIDLWENPAEASGLQLLKPLFHGARKRARELGYGLEVYRPTKDGISPDRLHRILGSRGQYGLIVPPVPESAMHYHINLEGMAGVTVGTSLRQPLIHRVAPNLFQGSQLACTKLREQGHRRIGMVLSEQLHQRVEKTWIAALLAEQQHWPRTDRLPPLLLKNWDKSRFEAWYTRHQPDVILLGEPQVDTWVTQIPSALAVGPRRIWLLVEGHRHKTQGIDYRGDEMGAAAVEMVVGQIHRNERGDPRIPNTLLLPGIWSAS